MKRAFCVALLLVAGCSKNPAAPENIDKPPADTVAVRAPAPDAAVALAPEAGGARVDERESGD